MSAVFRRADFETRCDEARRAMRLWPVLIPILGFPVLFAVMSVIPDLSAKNVRIAEYVFLGGAMAALFLSAGQQDRAVKRLGLRCPSCDASLFGSRRYNKNIDDVVLETGKCESCGLQILEPEEVGPRAAEAQPGSNVKAIGFIALLVAGIGATAFFGNAAVTRRRAVTCRRVYAAALTAADSIRADTYRLSRRGTITCGDLRRRGKLGG